MATGYELKDKGQERQEAKTQDSQEDERQEASKREKEYFTDDAG